VQIIAACVRLTHRAWLPFANVTKYGVTTGVTGAAPDMVHTPTVQAAQQGRSGQQSDSTARLIPDKYGQRMRGKALPSLLSMKEKINIFGISVFGCWPFPTGKDEKKNNQARGGLGCGQNSQTTADRITTNSLQVLLGLPQLRTARGALHHK